MAPQLGRLRPKKRPKNPGSIHSAPELVDPGAGIGEFRAGVDRSWSQNPSPPGPERIDSGPRIRQLFAGVDRSRGRKSLPRGRSGSILAPGSKFSWPELVDPAIFAGFSKAWAPARRFLGGRTLCRTGGLGDERCAVPAFWGTNAGRAHYEARLLRPSLCPCLVLKLRQPGQPCANGRHITLEQARKLLVGPFAPGENIR